MPNPLLQMFMPQNNGIQNIVNAYKTMQDPNKFIQNNPQLQSILSMYNGDAKTAFYTLCKQRNINPEDILRQLK